MYPVRKTGKGLPKDFNKLYVPSKMLLIDGRDVQKHRKVWIDEWLKAIAK
jgi:ABC-type thiamine transport system substrate-binding protein